MRVAHLTTVDMSLRYLVLPQLEEVTRRGGDAIGISAPGPHVAEIEQKGIQHIPLPTSTRGMHPLADLRAAWDLASILRHEKLDILHTHNPKPGLYGRVIGRLAGVPIVANTVHGLYVTPDDRFLRRAIVYTLEAIASRFSDLELIQNPEDLELLTRLRISPPHRTSLLGNGVDLKRFHPANLTNVKRDVLRKELNVERDQVMVGTVGRLVVEKGLRELFEAARILGDRYAFFVIGPDDPEKADAVPAAEIATATAQGVRFLGMRSDVEQLYGAMDIFVLPSHREGFPRAAMEAAASGLPVVATDIRGCRQVVQNGENGLLVPLRNAEQLAAAIRQLGEDPALRRKLSEAGRRIALEHFDEDRVVEIVMDAYERAGRAKGLGWSAGSALQPLQIRTATPTDAPVLAALHSSSIVQGFLPKLGTRFMRHLYAALVQWDGAVVVVADDGHGPVGFVAGVHDTGEFYRYFVRRYGPRAGLAAVPHLLKSGNLRRAWETWTYRDAAEDPTAELLSMAVAPAARGQGLSKRLGEEFLNKLRSAGVKRIKVVVGADNTIAISAYRKLGFRDLSSVEVHAGEPSVVLIRE